MSELQNCCGTTCNKSAMAEELSQLQQRNAKLMAQVEQYKKYVIVLTHADETGYIDDVGFVENFEEIREQVEQLVAGHDREVAARAGRAGFVAGWDACFDFSAGECAITAEGYANKIKSGEVKL